MGGFDVANGGPKPFMSTTKTIDHLDALAVLGIVSNLDLALGV